MGAIEFASLIGSCMECGSVVYNATVDGRLVAVEYAESRAARVGLVAINPVTRRARELTEENMPDVDAWRRRGATLHQLHTEQCVKHPDRASEDPHAVHA